MSFTSPAMTESTFLISVAHYRHQQAFVNRYRYANVYVVVFTDFVAQPRMS
jgi:hypothetical protein